MSFPIPSKSIILLEEAARMARLDHPNIVKIIAVSKLSFSGLNFLSKFRRTLQISTSAINCHGMVAWRILVRIFSTLYSGLVNRKMTNLATPLQEREERERPTIKLREILHILSQVEFLLDLKFILV